MDFSVTILGSNSAITNHGRHPTSQIVTFKNQYFLIDCGEGTQNRLQENKIKWFQINQIFISHLHGDHYFGLIGLLNTFHLMRRKEKLTIYCPKPLQDIIQIQLNASNTKLGYELEYIFTQANTPEIIFENNTIEISSFPLKHKIPTTGFLFKEKHRERKLILEKLEKIDVDKTQFKQLKLAQNILDNNGNVLNFEDFTEKPKPNRSYAFCSDTMYFLDIINTIQNVDLLYHEATFIEEAKERAIETMHSTTIDAATIAKNANAKKLIIGHFSSRYYHLSQLEDEAKTVFENTELAIENTVFYID